MEQNRVRKIFRKSTQSCTECRRRKIRCTFSNDNQSVCIQCSSRGSRCVDQRLDNANGDEKKSLRDRVARLEALLEAAVKDGGEGKKYMTVPVNQVDDVPPTNHDAEREDTIGTEAQPISMVTILDQALGDEEGLVSRSEDNLTLRPVSSTDIPYPQPLAVETSILLRRELIPNNSSGKSKTKHDQVCGALRSSLPKYDDLVSAISRSGSWWKDYRHKMYGHDDDIESLDEYAARVYIKGTPIELGILVSAFGLIADVDGSSYLALVDSLIVSDDEYAATLSGMECIILQGKCYIDIGKPRKAWLTYQRGLTMARLINLHRTHHKTLKSDNIWWTLYQGDRMMSVILGLSYSINDSHCYLGFYSDREGIGMARQPFILRCGLAAGKLIDRNQINGKISMSKTIEIDEDLQDIAAAMPQDWWDITSLQEKRSVSSVAETRERVCSHVYWLVLRMHLYLPFLLKKQQNPGFNYEHNRTQCVESARMLLDRYHVLRSNINGQCVYDSKTTDFIGFTASIVMIIGISQSNVNKELHTTSQSIHNWNLLETSVENFRRLNKSSPCRLYSQCYQALSILMGVEHPGQESSLMIESSLSKIYIPYFGTISTRRSARDLNMAATRPHSSNQSGYVLPTTTSQTADDNDRSNIVPTLDFIESGNEATQAQHNDPTNSAMFDFDSCGDIFGAFNGIEDSITWLGDNMPMVDIDQDWNWMDTAL